MNASSRWWIGACAGLMLSVVVAGCAAEAPPGPRPVPAVMVPKAVTPQMPRDGYVPGVENFGFISADVWRGAKPTAAGLKLLADMGVRTVIDLRPDDESADIPAGVRYVRLPVSGFHADLVDTLAVLAAIEGSPKPVFVHCLEGRDRTGLAIAAYRLTQGMSRDDAIREMNNFRVNFWWRQPIERKVRQLADAGQRVMTGRPVTTAPVAPAGHGS